MSKDDLKLFDPVEFPELKAKVEAPKPKMEIPGITVTLKPAIAQIEAEIGKLQSGRSTLRKGGLQIDHRTPAMAALTRLKENEKDVKQLEEFVKLSYQDFGARVTNHFIDLIAEAYPRIKGMKNV